MVQTIYQSHETCLKEVSFLRAKSVKKPELETKTWDDGKVQRMRLSGAPRLFPE
jgi:hypothetical protein